ncbi:hypothetical protein ACFXJ5_27735 [Streptomyces sp. NPDC059373]
MITSLKRYVADHPRAVDVMFILVVFSLAVLGSAIVLRQPGGEQIAWWPGVLLGASAPRPCGGFAATPAPSWR